MSNEIQEMQKELETIRSKAAEDQKSPDYIRMMGRNKRLLTNINKNAARSPWEWSWGLDYFVQFLKFMRDYYKLGKNVHAVEDKEWKKGVKYTRLEGIELALHYYDMWQNIEKDYVKIAKDEKDPGFHCVYKYGSAKKTYKKLAKVQKKYKHLFFKTVEEHIEEWWD